MKKSLVSAFPSGKASQDLAHIYLYDGDTLVTGPGGTRSATLERGPSSSHRWRFSRRNTERRQEVFLIHRLIWMEMLQNAAGCKYGFCLPVCRNAHAFLPGMASMQGRSAVPPAAGSAPRRQSAVLLNRCAWDSPFFRLHDQAQVPHPVRFFSVPFR